MSAVIGEPRVRVDAEAKVRGAATYSAEHQIDGITHGVMVLATIASGRIASIDASESERVPGFVGLLTRENSPKLNGEVTGRPGLDKRLPLLGSDLIQYDRQPIAVVVAETLEAAQEAATKLRVAYDASDPIATMDDSRAGIFAPEKTTHGEAAEMTRGNVPAARAAAPVVLSMTYETPVENHNPIEPHASIAQWDGDSLTIYDATQGVFEERRKLASVFGIPEHRVRVISPFVGGGFGNKGSVWSHQCLAAAAARLVGRPVKLVLLREPMFATTGHRPHTIQHLRIGAGTDGKIASLEHEVLGATSVFDVFIESSGEYSATAYAVPNVDIRHRLMRLNVGTPTFMRAPGEATGTFVLEAAMDELAEAVQLDPIELRLRNYAETDPEKGTPFSTKLLKECYARGAERIGWHRRGAPRSLRDGRELIGLGMATAFYPSVIFPAAARVTMHADGSVVAQSGTHEIGQGSYTALAQIVADELAIDAARVSMELGDTSLPKAGNSGGSSTIASVGSALALAARKLKARLDAQGGKPSDTPLTGEAEFEEPDKRKGYTIASWGAQFAEVGVDPDFGTVRVRRMVGIFDVGRVINERTAHSQLIGGMTMGVGMALLEGTKIDPHRARMMNANLADYHLPVNADIGEMTAEMLGVPDPIADEIGTKPVGEIGICGATAAIVNAVYNATGRRVRDLPVRPAKLLR